MLFIALPCSILLVEFAYPITSLLFQRGAFTVTDTEATTKILEISALAIPAIVGLRILLAGFLAREDTVTPMKITFILLLTNIAIAIPLAHKIGFIGIPIAATLTAWGSFLLTATLLYRKGHFRIDAPLVWRIFSLVISGAVMTVTLQAFQWYTGTISFGLGASADQLANLLLFALTGLIVYFVASIVTGNNDLKLLIQMTKRSPRGIDAPNIE